MPLLVCGRAAAKCGRPFCLAPRLPATCRCCACSRVQRSLFDGSGPEWLATVTAMGRQSVEVELGAPSPARSVS